MRAAGLALAALLFAAPAARAAAADCAYRDLAFGPYVPFALGDDVVVSPDEGFALVRTANSEPKIYFAGDVENKTFPVRSDRPFVILNENEIGFFSGGGGMALNVRTGAQHPPAPKRAIGARFITAPQPDRALAGK